VRDVLLLSCTGTKRAYKHRVPALGTQRRAQGEATAARIVLGTGRRNAAV